jgi:hypothetical protein
MSHDVDPGTALAPLLRSLALPSEFGGTGLELPEGLAFAEWERLGDSLAALERTVGWWIGDWWAYGQHAYGARAKVAAESRFELSTLMNYGSVSRAIAPSRRRELLSFSHHQAVTNLPLSEQELFLERAASERWNRSELRTAIKVRRAESIPLPEGRYRTLTADPPWQVGAGPPFGGSSSRPLEYPTMSLEEIAALPVRELAADDAHLYRGRSTPTSRTPTTSCGRGASSPRPCSCGRRSRSAPASGRPSASRPSSSSSHAGAHCRTRSITPAPASTGGAAATRRSRRPSTGCGREGLAGTVPRTLRPRRARRLERMGERPHPRAPHPGHRRGRRPWHVTTPARRGPLVLRRMARSLLAGGHPRGSATPSSSGQLLHAVRLRASGGARTEAAAPAGKVEA